MTGTERMRLTDAAITRLRPREREYTVWDTRTLGLGVRVRPSGGRSFVLLRKTDGRSTRLSLGSATSMRVDDARRQCHALRAPSKSHGIGPRLHDMRHRFAVNTLLRWYRDGVDVERHIPRLATWLGHAHVSDTYWYLTATPELMQIAARRLDRIARRSSS